MIRMSDINMDLAGSVLSIIIALSIVCTLGISFYVQNKFYQHSDILNFRKRILEGRHKWTMEELNTEASKSLPPENEVIHLHHVPASDGKLKSVWTTERVKRVDVEKILEMNVKQLLLAMASGKFTSVELVVAYIGQCIKVGRDLNAITEEFFEEALTAAAASDARRANGKPPRILEGIPVSIKDCFNQIGADSTCGLISRLGKPASKDCPLVQLLRNAGAIPFVRSNVPPILMAWETSNNIFESTLNPWNKDRITGGSSGGEGALIAARCSPLGIGTDIGGSVRIPAAMCGLFSLKPTSRRVSTKGLICQEVPGQIAVLSCPGPMARSVDDLETVMKVWLGDNQSVEHNAPVWKHDPYIPPVAWRGSSPSVLTPVRKESPPSRRFRIGYFHSNLIFSPHVSCIRAVDEAIEELKEQDAEVVEWIPPAELKAALYLWNKIMTADRGQWLRNELSGEHPHFTVAGAVILGLLPDSVCSGIGTLLQLFGYTKRLGEYLSSTFGRPVRSAAEDWRLNYEMIQFQELFLNAFNDAELDAVICPTVGLPAVEHGMSVHLLPAVTYTTLFNLLQWPAGHVPITTVRQDECYYRPPENEVYGKDIISETAQKQMEGALGLPVGIQVASLPYADEKVISLMRMLEKKFPFHPAC